MTKTLLTLARIVDKANTLLRQDRANVQNVIQEQCSLREAKQGVMHVLMVKCKRTKANNIVVAAPQASMQIHSEQRVCHV